MMPDRRLEDFRYERKFLCDPLDVHQVRAMIRSHPRMFVSTYPPRFVNNLYLDSKGMDAYLDSVNGVGNRRKVRVRWYGDLFGRVEHATVEFKVKRGLAGTKDQHDFGSFVLDESFSDRYFRNILSGGCLPEHTKTRLKHLDVVLLNRYHRQYFATVDGDYRITVDSNMTFYRVDRLRNRFLRRQTDHRTVVMELKYQVGQERNADRIASYFPFRATKNSKYVKGVERTFW